MSDAEPSGTGAAFLGNQNHDKGTPKYSLANRGNLDRHDRQT
jgi:hypothetical protein